MLIHYLFLLMATGSSLGILGLAFRSLVNKWALVVCDLALGFLCLFWLLSATVSRFSHTGRVCSGGYQNVREVMYPYDFMQGQFLYWAVLIGWTLPVAALVTVSVLCPRRSSLYRPSSEF